MIKLKKIIWGAFSILIIFVLASCGTNNSDTTTGTGSELEEDKGITTKLEVKEDGNGTFTIKNESAEETTLTYPSGQEVEYQLLDEQDNIVFTYSTDKVFILMITEKMMQPNEEIVIPLDLKTEFAEVPAGSYKLVVWSTAETLSDQKQEVAYEWSGSEFTEESKGTITVYRGDANAEYVEPYEVTIDPTGDLVHQIFEEIMVLEVRLIDYRLEDNNSKLVLNMDNGIVNVQGSAGENMFIGTIVHSYFENFPELEEIYFEKEGKSPVELAHIVVTEPFTRDKLYTSPE